MIAIAVGVLLVVLALASSAGLFLLSLGIADAWREYKRRAR